MLCERLKIFAKEHSNFDKFWFFRKKWHAKEEVIEKFSLEGKGAYHNVFLGLSKGLENFSWPEQFAISTPQNTVTGEFHFNTSSII